MELEKLADLINQMLLDAVVAVLEGDETLGKTHGVSTAIRKSVRALDQSRSELYQISLRKGAPLALKRVFPESAGVPKDEFVSNGYILMPAYLDRVSFWPTQFWRVWCPHCARWHTYAAGGMTDDPEKYLDVRPSQCSVSTSPYYREVYGLRNAGYWHQLLIDNLSRL